LAAICAGLAAPEQKLAFLRKWAHPKIKRELKPANLLFKKEADLRSGQSQFIQNVFGTFD